MLQQLWDIERPGSGRDPEDRPVPEQAECVRDKMLDKTLADSFPSSDPLSTIPNPCKDSFCEGLPVAGDNARFLHSGGVERPQPGQQLIPGQPEKAA